MELLKVIFISIIQGVAEFLPISSSGHILLFKQLLGLDFDMSFDLTIHFGTLLAVIFVYWRDIAELIKGLFCKEIDSKTFGRTLKRKEVFLYKVKKELNRNKTQNNGNYRRNYQIECKKSHFTFLNHFKQ